VSEDITVVVGQQDIVVETVAETYDITVTEEPIIVTVPDPSDAVDVIVPEEAMQEIEVSFGLVGPQGPQGEPGAPGGSLVSSYWNYASQTTPPPTSGSFRTTNPPVGDPITLWVHKTDAAGRIWFGNLPQPDERIIIRDKSQNRYDIDILSVTDDGTYVTVDGVLSSSTGVAPKKNEECELSLVMAPVPGPAGPQGPPGAALVVISPDPPLNPEPGTIWVPAP
jgi:hypothetical protein